MANNTTTAIMEKILARALRVLRNANVMPVLVNGDYSTEAKKKGNAIDIEIPPTSTTSAVTPAATPPDPDAQTPEVIQIPLDQWHHADPFKLSDKDIVELDTDKSFIPPNLEAAMAAIADKVNADLLGVYKGVYGFFGTPGTTPFASNVQGATRSRKVLNQQKAPSRLRRMVLDPDAEAQALELAAFSDVDKTGEQIAKMEGFLGRKFGFDMVADQQVPTHTAGTLTGDPATTGVTALGAKTVNMTCDGDDVIALLEGDIVEFAGDTQTYVVTADLSVGNSATGDLLIEPGLKVAQTGSEAITVKGDHVVNLAFHRDAIAFVNRPLSDATEKIASNRLIAVQQDPVTKLIVRLELISQYKQSMWDLDILYGKKLIRPELATRLAG